MRSATRIFFVTGSSIAAIPAILGGFVGTVGILALVAVATLLCAILGLAIAICCVPLIVWCALFEMSNEKVKRPKVAVPELN